MFKKVIRGISFFVAIFLQLPFVNFVLNSILPYLSPFVASLTLISGHKIGLEFVLALPIFILAIFTGRWFCWNICPVGTLLYYIQKLSPFPKQLFFKMPNVNKLLLFCGFITAIFGIPVFAAFDPLVILNSFFAGLFLAIEKNAGVFLIYIIPLVLIMVFTFLIPNLWCEKICPLGCMQHLLRIPFKTNSSNVASESQIKNKMKTIAISRRFFIYAIISFLPAMFLAFLFNRKTLPKAVRPPGSSEKIALLCIRCGACVEICPQKIIMPDMKNGFFFYGVPRLNYTSTYCNELCNKCTLVCPTGAINPLSISQKRRTKIGEAKIDKSKCIAWNAGEACMVCHEFCPYQAIAEKKHRGVNCPIVISEKCIGCGACESQCPARPVKAIIVYPAFQTLLATPN